MLISGIRNVAAALTLVAVLVVGAAPAQAFKDEGLAAREKRVPVLLDALIMRPMGLVVLAGGTAVAVPAALFTLATRPTDVIKPIDALVATPFRYTFLDPLGEHPPVGNY